MTLSGAVEQEMRVIVAEEVAKVLPSIVPTIVARVVAALQRGEEGGSDQ